MELIWSPFCFTVLLKKLTYTDLKTKLNDIKRMVVVEATRIVVMVCCML